MATHEDLAPPKPRGWKRYVPIGTWGPQYDRSWLSADFVAALTIWALLVPESMAYASLAGMPPQAGLYAALAGPALYAVFGTSRQLNVGPSSTVAVMSAAVIIPLADGDPTRFVELTTALAIVVGLTFIVAGFLKLGFIADFLSKPVLDGFIIGLALTIAAGQLHKLFGIETEADNFFQDIWFVVRDLDMTNWWTLAIGVGSLVLLFGLEGFLPRVPAALAVTALSIAVVSIWNLDEKGVLIIGDIPAEIPLPGIPSGLSMTDWGLLVTGGLGIVIVAFAESIAAARSYASKYRYAIDPDQELIALGASNVGAGLLGGFAVAGSLSKSAAGDQAGQRTQMASVILFFAVLITIGLLTGLFRNLAEATLGAIVINAVWPLINFNKVGRYRRIRSEDFAAGLAALVGVLFFDILVGLAVAVTLSVLALVARASRPHWAVLGQVRDEAGDDIAFQNVQTHPDATTFPGLVLLRFDADLFFANANVFRAAVLKSAAVAEPPPTVVLVDAEAITDIDATAMAMLKELEDALADEGVELWFARVRQQISARMAAYRAIADVKPRHVYPSLRAAVRHFQSM